jgi:hypothetical protein
MRISLVSIGDQMIISLVCTGGEAVNSPTYIYRGRVIISLSSTGGRMGNL